MFNYFFMQNSFYFVVIAQNRFDKNLNDVFRVMVEQNSKTLNFLSQS